MIQEPLLDNALGDAQANGGIADLTNPTQVGELGALIRDSVGYNATDVWFNLMFPSAYAPFMQILTQTWSSIESKQWIDNQVVGQPGRTEWDGNWPDTTSWLTYWNPPVGSQPLDNPTPLMYGSGPFQITTLDYTSMFWAGTRHVNYWRGWPADFPMQFAVVPEGYIDTIYVTWANAWATRLADMTSGACDFAAVPRQNVQDIYKSVTPPWAPPGNYPIDGVRCIQPLPTLAVDAFFFTFDINPATLYGPIGPPGVFNPTLIPSDFFGNAVWGINVRKGFAQAFDYATFLTVAYKGEAIHPATAIIPGLSYYDPTVTGYSYNLLAANASFNAVPGLKTTGFTLTLLYNTGNLARQTACNLLQTAIQSLNPRYTVIVSNIDWASYLHAAVAQKLPMFSIGWLADFPDPHDFALPFYRTGGTFSSWQGYTNPAMDALVDAGILTPDGTARAAIYRQIQLLAISDCPSFTLDQAVGRHFERDWVVGWYYNPVYPGQFFYNLWKWYYAPLSEYATTANPPTVPSSLAGFNIPEDVNYNGIVNMLDVGYVAHAFGTKLRRTQDGSLEAT